MEVLPTPFLPAGVCNAWGLTEDDPRRRTVALLNPLEADRDQLATTLLPGLLKALVRNVARGQRDVALYGMAPVVQPHTDATAMPDVGVLGRPSDAEEIAALDRRATRPAAARRCRARRAVGTSRLVG